MSSTAVVGLQWGDEGKGKIVDILAEEADLVVRFGGGANAGHTLVVGEQKYVFHLLPSGIVRPETRCLLGAGMVIDPSALVEEIETCHRLGLNTTGRIVISPAAHVVTEYHKAADQIGEGSDRPIGTTLRGIGPAYEDRAGRRGIPMSWLRYPERILDILSANARRIEPFARQAGVPLPPPEAETHRLVRLGAMLIPYVGDVRQTVSQALDSDKHVLFEGAQGTMLDILHGTYPYVTSSQVIAAGAATGTGLGPSAIQTVVGVAKAYTTRVGLGPFPTELTDETGDRIRDAGGEFGATTGRPRRCGWLDLPILRLAKKLNGVTELALTKLDVLAGLDRIAVATGYRIDGRVVAVPPEDPDQWAQAEPLYEWFEGFEALPKHPSTVDELPAQARRYLQAISDDLGVDVTILSLGPGRSQTLRGKIQGSPDRGV